MRGFFPWFLALLTVLALLAAVPFASRDGDSWLYARIAEQMAARPLAELFAPQWFQLARLYVEDHISTYFYEHPPGLFVLPVLLAKLGYPAARAAYAVDLLFQLGCFWASYRLARLALPRAAARYVVLGLALVPLSFQYAVRANHETPLLFFFLVGLWAALTLRRHRLASTLLLAGAFWGLVLVKGAMAIPAIGVVALAAGLAALAAPENREKELLWAATVALGTAASVVVPVLILEQGHRELTAHPFWETYWRIQVTHRALRPASEDPLLVRKAMNLGFYGSHLAWYAAPWSLVGAYALVGGRHDAPLRRLADPSVRARWLVPATALAGALLYCVAMSLSDRVAQRYIFPAYPLAALFGTIVALRRLPGLAAWCDRHVGEHALLYAALVWLVTRATIVTTASG